MISIILFTIFLNGCVNPAKDVPIIKVNVTYSEREGIVEASTYSFVQDNVSYINRPKKTVADSFPSLSEYVTFTFMIGTSFAGLTHPFRKIVNRIMDIIKMNFQILFRL